MKIVTTDMNKSDDDKNNHPAIVMYKNNLQKQSELVLSSTVPHSPPESSEKSPNNVAPRSIRLSSVITTPALLRTSSMPISDGARKSESTSTPHKYCDRHPDVPKKTAMPPDSVSPRSPKPVIQPTIPPKNSPDITPLSSRTRGGSMR